MKERVIYILIIVVLVMFTCDNIKSNKSNTTIDSTRVVKILPEIKGGFITPQPINTLKLTDKEKEKELQLLLANLQDKYKNSLDSIDLLNELIDAKRIREYQETYEDSVIVATVNEKVEGRLLERRFDYTIKPREIEYFEKTITEKLEPKFAAYLGTGFQSSPELIGSVFDVNLGIQGKKGNILEFGFNSNKHFRVGYKVQLFSKY